MSGPQARPEVNSMTAQGRIIRRVPDQTGEFIAPHMAADAHVVFTWPEPRPTVSIIVHGIPAESVQIVNAKVQS